MIRRNAVQHFLQHPAVAPAAAVPVARNSAGLTQPAHRFSRCPVSPPFPEKWRIFAPLGHQRRRNLRNPEDPAGRAALN
jgi:hypothetical protein